MLGRSSRIHSGRLVSCGAGRPDCRARFVAISRRSVSWAAHSRVASAAGRPALHGQHAVAPGQERVLAGSAALDDQDVAVLERLEGDGPQQGGGAAAGLPDRQQMGFGGAGAGPPDDRGGVAGGVAVVHRDRALHRVSVGEAQYGLAGGGDEALGADRGGQGAEDAHDEPVALFVPGEVVLAATAGLGVQQLLDPGPGGGLAVGEIGGIRHLEAGQPPVGVEFVAAEGLLPVAAVGEQRTWVVGHREVRHERLVQGPQPRGLRLVRAGLHRGPLPPRPGGGAHHRDQGDQAPVRHECEREDAGRDDEQRGATPVLGRRGPLLPSGRGQQPQTTGDRDQRMEDVRGVVGGRARELATASDRGAAAAQNAGEWSPGHVGLLKGWERSRRVRT